MSEAFHVGYIKGFCGSTGGVLRLIIMGRAGWWTGAYRVAHFKKFSSQPGFFISPHTLPPKGPSLYWLFRPKPCLWILDSLFMMSTKTL